MLALLISRDLTLVSQLDWAASRSGWRLATATPLDAATKAGELRPTAALLDLASVADDVQEVVRQIRQAAGDEIVLVAFGPHVHRAMLEAAAEAGCQHVLSRGELYARSAELFTTLSGS